MIITIDGPSASGKSSIAKMLSTKLGFDHLDTGAIYRCIAYFLDKKGVNDLDDGWDGDIFKDFAYKVEVSDNGKKHILCGQDVTKEIRTRKYTELSSKFSVIKFIRDFATSIQRDLSKGKNIVVEGRDIGSVVFPKAEIKFFLDADNEERAKRRYLELKEVGGNTDLSFNDILEEINNRDKRDRLRLVCPLICPEGAKKIDTTKMTLDQLLEKMITCTKKKPEGKVRRYFFSHKGRKCSLVYILTKWLFKAYFTLFHRYRVEGLENYPKDKAAIIACNHVSFYDPPMIAAACPEVVHGLARKSLFKNRIVSYWFSRINTYPLTGTTSDKEMMKKVFEVLNKGEKIIIFPEGTRSLDGVLKPLKKGLALLADRGNALVIPTCVIGPEKVLPRGRKLPKLFKPIKVVFGKPISFNEVLDQVQDKKQAREIFLKKIESAIQALLDRNKNNRSKNAD